MQSLMKSYRKFSKVAGYDAIILTTDGVATPVKRNSISETSPYFEVVFSNSTGSRKEIIIPGVSGQTMQLIRQFAESREAPVTDENFHELLIASDQFLVDGLVNECWAYAVKHLSPNNCIGLRKLARQYANHRVEEESTLYLKRNFPQVARYSEEFLNMSIQEVVALFSADDLNVCREEIVWEAAVRWIQKNPYERKEHIYSLMKQIRLGLMDTRYFFNFVKIHPLIQDSYECSLLIREVLKFYYNMQTLHSRTTPIATPTIAIPRIPHEVLFSVGGWIREGATSLIETYDTRADRWLRIPEVDFDGGRAFHGCVSLDFDIYVVGGFDLINYLSTCRCFNAVDRYWHSVASMHESRCCLSVVNLEYVIYAVGGFSKDGTHSSMEKYNPDTNEWIFTSSMNIPRAKAGADVLEDRIFIAGGMNDDIEFLSSAEYFDSKSCQWTFITQMEYERRGLSCIAYRKSLFALGGMTDVGCCNYVERYSVEDDQWYEVKGMNIKKSNFGAVVVDDMIFTVGGYNGKIAVYDVSCFDGEDWYDATDLNLRRSGLGVCLIVGLPNLRDYIHQNRDQLMEETRLKIREYGPRASYSTPLPTPGPSVDESDFLDPSCRSVESEAPIEIEPPRQTKRSRKKWWCPIL